MFLLVKDGIAPDLFPKDDEKFPRNFYQCGTKTVHLHTLHLFSLRIAHERGLTVLLDNAHREPRLFLDSANFNVSLGNLCVHSRECTELVFVHSPITHSIILRAEGAVYIEPVNALHHPKVSRIF